MAIDEHSPRPGIDQARNQANQGAFPCASRADNGNSLSRPSFQRNASQDWLAAFITKGHSFEAYFTAHRRQRKRAGSVHDLRLAIQDRIDPIDIGAEVLSAGVHPGEDFELLLKLVQVRNKNEQAAEPIWILQQDMARA